MQFDTSLVRRHVLRSLALLLSAAYAMLGPAREAIATHPSPLPDLIISPVENYFVHFTSKNPYDPELVPPPPTADLNYIHPTAAQAVADALDESGPYVDGDPNGYDAGYRGLGFKLGISALIPTSIYDCTFHMEKCLLGKAYPTFGIRFSSKTIIASAPARILMMQGHELFHHVHWAYFDYNATTGLGRAPTEGMARMMEDKVYSILDGPDSPAKYRTSVKGYLKQNGFKTLWELQYPAALFWNYLAEQYGTDTTEPHIGTDFIRTFWEFVELLLYDPSAGSDVNGPLTTELAIQSYDPNASLARAFRNFSVANVAKEFSWNVPNVPASPYRYVDENDGTGYVYPDVVRQYSADLSSVISNVGGTVRWSASYVEAVIQRECQGVLGFAATGEPSFAFALLGIRGGSVDSFTEKKTQNFSRAWLQDPQNPYTRLVAVVTGLDEGGFYNFSFACGTPTPQIKLPTEDFEAYVGDWDEKQSFEIFVRVIGPPELGLPSVRGLQKEDFSVLVAGESAPILGLAESNGDYFLKAQAPILDASANGLSFTLEVYVGTYGTSAANAVVYDDQILDEIIVLDLSGSMLDPASSPKIEAAQIAAPAFVDMLENDDQLGFVTFTGNATLEKGLEPATDMHRDDVKQRIRDAQANPIGSTSIGDGLATARDELLLHPSTGATPWIILLSDGAGNTPLSYDQVTASLTTAKIVVHTVPLGGSSDRPALERIARDHDGQSFYVHDGQGPAPALFSALTTTSSQTEIDANASVALRLTDAYLMAWEDRNRQQRLWEVQGTVANAETEVLPVVVDEAGLSRGRISIVWDDPTTALDVVVQDPLGSPLVDGVNGVEIFSDVTHVVIHKDVLAPGTYTLSLTALTGDPNFVGMFSGRTILGVEMNLFFDQVLDATVLSQGGTYAWGASIPILVLLTDSGGPITGASVDAKLRHPDGSEILLPLFDDGDHEDGQAGDGVYGNVYTRTTEASPTGLPDNGPSVPGTYEVRVFAEGLSNFGEGFGRIRKGSFSVFAVIDPPPDSDLDGQPDVYEDEHGCRDALMDDEGLDPDFDGISNSDEWEIGTDPCHSDTDRGGESDLSEVNRGANPFDPADDSMTAPIDPEVVDWVPDHYPAPPLLSQRNLIRYPSAPEYQSVRIWRSLSDQGPFSIVANVVPDGTALYADEPLANGTTYFYMVQGEGLSGVTSALSLVFSGTPKLDPIPNVGSIEINDDAPFTESVSASLSLRVEESDVAEMMISDDANLIGASWQPYAETLPWTLIPDPSGYAQVYARYRDTSLNVSAIYSDDIAVLSAGSLGQLTGFARYVDDPDAVGIAMLTSDPLVPPGFTDSTGNVNVYLLPGNYDLTFSASGYLSEAVLGVSVAAGSLTNFGVVVLPEPDCWMLIAAGCLLLSVARTRRARRIQSSR